MAIQGENMMWVLWNVSLHVLPRNQSWKHMVGNLCVLGTNNNLL